MNEKRKRRHSMRANLRSFLRGNKISAKIRHSLVGCSREELVAHIEKNFKPGMNWENRGQGQGKWNLDHLVPLAVFDLCNQQHRLLAGHYLNVKPEWYSVNAAKGKKMP